MVVFIESLSRREKRAILLMFDLLIVLLALLVAFGLHLNTFRPVSQAMAHADFLPVVLVSTVTLSVGLGIPGIKINAFETRAILRTANFSFLLALLSWGLNVISRVGISPSVFVLFGFLFFSISVMSRLVARNFLIWLCRQGRKRTRILVYGAGATGVQLVAATGQSDDIEAVGFIDDNRALQGILVAGLQVFAPSRIPDLLKDRKIDRVVLAMPSLSAPRQSQIVRKLTKLGCDVHRLPSFSELVGNRALVDKLEPVQPADYLGRKRIDDSLPVVAATYSDKRVMITGAGGSIGSELCRQILPLGPERIILLEQSEPALYAIDMELRTLNEDARIEIVPALGSVTDPVQVRKILGRYSVDIILHTAAHKHVPLVESNPIEGLRNNVLGTKCLADAARDYAVGQFVLVSSDKAVRPTNVMGATKRMSELVVQDLASRGSSTLFSMVRFGNVLGSSGSVIPLFQEQIARGGPVTLTDDNVERYFMTLSEAAKLVLIAGAFSHGGDVFVLDMGKPVRIRKLAAEMIKRAGYTVRDPVSPDGDIEIVITGLRPGEKLYEELLIGANTQTTPHPKILRAQETALSEIEVASMLKDIRGIVETGSDDEVCRVVHRWVEGYQTPSQVQVVPSDPPTPELVYDGRTRMAP